MPTIEDIRARAEAATQWVKQRTCASDITSGESGKIRRSLEIDIPFLLGEIERLMRKSQNQSDRIGELMQALERGHKRAETAESESTEALEAARHSNAKYLREKERADKAEAKLAEAVEDLESCMHYADPKNNNTCNFCAKDMAEYPEKCQGRENAIMCSPKWRGLERSENDG